MKKHWKYLRYLVRHKWFVLIAGRAAGVSLWRLLIHDWSKFLPCEWLPYARYFYGGDEYNNQVLQREFDAAWLHHQHFNPHHWQHWVLREDSGETKILEMPEHLCREMLADWQGAGRAITGQWGAEKWYAKNRSKIQLAPKTRIFVDTALEFTPPSAEGQ